MRKNGAATRTTTNMTLTTWHRRHGRTDDQLDDNDGGEMAAESERGG